tara:strand:+ start:4342 stop:5040 length:699 start_codon:yes stop_codon:yes gene_type:complete
MNDSDSDSARESDAYVVSEEDKTWTRQRLEALAIDDTMVMGEMLITRTAEKGIKVLASTERSMPVVERLALVLEAMDWDADIDEVRMTPDDPTQAVMEAQREALSWMCPSGDCEERIANMTLENATWESLGEHTAIEEGEEVLAERWVARVNCNQCEHVFDMAPLDYGLLAGEDLFYTWRIAEDNVLRVLPREELVELMDNDVKFDYLLLGSAHDGNPAPPHMRGTLCIPVE